MAARRHARRTAARSDALARSAVRRPYGGVYTRADVIDCIEGRLDEPKNSGRRVAAALEVEIALKISSAEGAVRVDLPLADRSLSLSYDWFR